MTCTCRSCPSSNTSVVLHSSFSEKASLQVNNPKFNVVLLFWLYYNSDRTSTIVFSLTHIQLLIIILGEVSKMKHTESGIFTSTTFC